MTTRYTLDDNQRKAIFRQVLKAQVKSHAVFFAIFIAIGVAFLGVGFGLHIRDLWISAFGVFGLSVPFGLACLANYGSAKQHIIGDQHGVVQYELTIDETSTQLKDVDSDELVRYNNNNMKTCRVTQDAVVLVFANMKMLCIPRNPDVECALSFFPVSTTADDDKKRRGVFVGWLVIVLFVLVAGIYMVVANIAEKDKISYLSDATYQQLECCILNTYEESGVLCIEADILTDGHTLQPLEGGYRFAFVSKNAKNAGLKVGDVITIKSTSFCGKGINAYLVAYLAKNEVVYVAFDTGKCDVHYWQLNNK